MHETQLWLDAYIKESRLFMYILNNSDILFRFLYVNAYFGVSIHLNLFFVSNHGKKKKKQKKMGNLLKEFFLRKIKICRFKKINGVKYVYCIKHGYKFLLREQLEFAAVL